MKDDRLVEEYIGASIKIIGASDPKYENIHGKVVDETKNTFIIGNDRDKIVPKKGCLFKIALNDSWKTIKGEDIMYRPEDRIKKLGR